MMTQIVAYSPPLVGGVRGGDSIGSLSPPPNLPHQWGGTKRRVRRCKNNGFSLIEVLLATAIVSGGVIAVAQGFASGLLAYNDTKDTELALNIAQAKMEEIKNTLFAALVDSGPTADPHFSNFRVTVNTAEGQDPMRVEVTVSWNVKGGESNLVLTTLVTNY